MSSFDDLLADLREPAKTGSNGAGGSGEDFDPFGPSVTVSSSGGDAAATSDGLLLDFTVDSKIQNGGSTNGVEEPSGNPLYNMSANSSNPLYDLSSPSPTGNPLYDLEHQQEDPSASSNPLYEFDTPPADTTTTTTTEGSSSSNPLYDFDALDSSSNAQDNQVDLLSGGGSQQVDLLAAGDGATAEEPAQPDLLAEDLAQPVMETQQAGDAEALFVVSEPAACQPQEEEEVPAEDERFVDQDIAQDIAVEENQHRQEPVDSLLDFSTTVEHHDEDIGYTQEEVVITQEETTQDDVTVTTTTTRTEHRYSGSGPDSSQFSTESYVTNQSEPTVQTTNEQNFVSQTESMSSEMRPQTFQDDEEEEEGVHESQPVARDDVVRESDKDIGAELPAVGTASSMRAKFLSSQPPADQTSQRAKREITPPAHGSGGEYVSEPRTVLEHYEGKADAGVFESQPEHDPNVITSDMVQEDAVPEQGFAKNVAAKFRELESKGSAPSPSGGKREITPDRSGRVEFVSEPRGHTEHYEGHAESGVFESQPVLNPEVVRSGQEVEEQLPERGMAKNLAQKFRQISSDTTSPPSAGRAKREITPDTSGRTEYTSEPRGQRVEEYQPQAEAGVFENQPHGDENVVRSDELAEEFVPERGFAKNVAAKFRELESTAKSPPISPGRRKEFTPPRDDSGKRASGVYESTPEVKPDLVHSGDQHEEALPERGTAKNMAQRFRQLEAENRSPGGSTRAKKEFTPPPGDSGVFENQPAQFQADYNRPAESGIVENQPIQRDDVVRGAEPPKYEEELPERGMARNLVSRWRQMESESAKAVVSPGSAGGRQKEFTPPRDEPQAHRKSPRTPMSPNMDNGSVHPSELPGQYQPAQEASVFESTPDRRPDVYREEDTDWTEGMPKKDTAKKMLARFQKIQTEAKESEAKEHTPRKEEHGSANQQEPSEQEPGKTQQEPEPKPEPAKSQREPEPTQYAPEPAEPEMEKARLMFEDPSQVGRSKSMRAAIQTEKCGACDKTVYAMERMEMNKRIYHRACFRCSKCKAVLTAKTFAINNEVIFCTTHYKQMFTTKGNYDEGFGRTQHKTRWNSHPNLAEAADSEGAAVNGKS